MRKLSLYNDRLVVWVSTALVTKTKKTPEGNKS